MPIDQGELRDLLDERSRQALDRPIPWHALRSRARGARLRRLSAVAVAVAVVATGITVSLRDTDERDRLTLAEVIDKLPSRYEESDGTVYRRLATAALDTSREKKTTFQVEVSGKPVAILPDCPAPKAGQLQVTARVPGLDKVFTLSPAPFLGNACERGIAVDMKPFPAGTRRVTFTIETYPSRQESGKWRFGVYEWTPPATMKAASPPAEPPATISRKLRLVTKAGTTWPASREVTLTVPGTGHGLAIVTYCGDGLAERLAQKLWVNGRPAGTSGCSFPRTAREGSFTYLGKRVPTGKTVTIKVRLVLPFPEYLRRPGTLTVAVYAGDL